MTILGCGHSGGTPQVGLGWGAADSKNPKNRRLRPSILVDDGPTRILVDASPDLRQQLLAAGVDRLDAVLFTHAHADHCHGIDDLRAINEAMGADLPAYADTVAWDMIGRRFDYVLTPKDAKSKFYYKPVLMPTTIKAGDRFSVKGVEILAFDQDHGFLRTLGFRFGKVAYSTDVVNLPEESFAALTGVEVWIVGTLGLQPHPTHAHVAKAVEWIERVGAREAWLTHMSHRIDYAAVTAQLPPHIRPAHDGLTLDIS